MFNKTAQPSLRVLVPSSAVIGALNAFGLFARLARIPRQNTPLRQIWCSLANWSTMKAAMVDERKLLTRFTVDPKIFGGKPIIRGRRLAVEHVVSMLAAGDTSETILEGYPWLQPEDIQACLAYAKRVVGHERIEPLECQTGS